MSGFERVKKPESPESFSSYSEMISKVIAMGHEEPFLTNRVTLTAADKEPHSKIKTEGKFEYVCPKCQNKGTAERVDESGRQVWKVGSEIDLFNKRCSE